MKVLFNGLQAGNRSGTGVYTRELAKQLVSLGGGIDIRVFWPRDISVPKGVDERFFLPVGAQSTMARLVFDHWTFVTSARETMSDVLHYPCTFAGLRKFRHTVVTIHDISFLRNPAWFRADRALYYRKAIKMTLNRAAMVITGSQYTACDLEEMLGFSRERVRVTPYAARSEFRPLDEAAQQAVRTKYKLPNRFFLCLGTFEPRKNLERCVLAFSQIAAKLSSDLVLAGRWGWKTRGLRAVLNDSPYAGRIHLPGFIMDEDLPAVLSAATALLYPSLYEGFGLPVIEAMACGTPVVVSRASSLPEVAGDAALYVDPYDTEALSQALIALDSEEQLRCTLREKGLQRAKTFSWARTAELTLAVYRELAGK